MLVFWAEETLAPSARSETSSGEHSDPRQTTRPSRLALTGWKLMFLTGESTMTMSCFSGANPMFVYQRIFLQFWWNDYFQLYILLTGFIKCSTFYWILLPFVIVLKTKFESTNNVHIYLQESKNYNLKQKQKNIAPDLFDTELYRNAVTAWGQVDWVHPAVRGQDSIVVRVLNFWRRGKLDADLKVRD